MARKTIEPKVIARLAERLPIGGDAPACCAPCGDYEVTAAENARLHFCQCDGAAQFFLSIDAVMQHMNEGRIRMNGGANLPRA